MINKSNLYVSPLLTQFSLAYKNSNYVAELIMPIVKVNKDSGKIATYGMDNLRIANSIRAQGSSTNEVNHSVSIGDHYFLEEHALKELVTNEEVENADKPIDPKKDAVDNLMERILVIKEKALADTMGNTAILTQNVTLAGNDQWSDFTNSTPIADIMTGIAAVRTGTGKMANTLFFSYSVWLTLLQHPDFVNRVKVGVADSDAIKGIIMKAFPMIKNIIIGEAQYNSGVEGGTDTLTDIWGKNAWVLAIESSPSLKSRTFGLTYQGRENRMVDESGPQQNGEAWDRKGTFIRVTDKYDQKLVDVNCAYLIKNAIA